MSPSDVPFHLPIPFSCFFYPDTLESCSVANLSSLGNTLATGANNTVLAKVIHQIFVNWKECTFLTKAGPFFLCFPFGGSHGRLHTM